MEIARIIRDLCGESVIKVTKLSGGISFNTYKAETRSGRSYVFRYGENYTNSGGRYIDVAETFRREKHFFDSVADKLLIKVPHIYLVDDSREQFEYIYEVYDFIEGRSLEDLENADDEIYYQIGKAIGCINGTTLCDSIDLGDDWGPFFSNRLMERLIPLIRDGLISEDEIQTICSFFRDFDYPESRAFLHLDVRKSNILYDEKTGSIGLIDAENAEFGDPLFEIARIDVYNEMNDAFYKGYMEEMGVDRIDRGSIRYHGYELESLAFLTNVFIHEIEAEEETVENMKSRTVQLKDLVLHTIRASV